MMNWELPWLRKGLANMEPSKKLFAALRHLNIFSSTI
jgi:hypothetical protein